MAQVVDEHKEDEKKPWVHKLSVRVTKDEALTLSSSYRQAAHAMFFSPSSKKVFGSHKMKWNVLMTMRFDGTFGFPGGFIDYDQKGEMENLEKGLNRELVEEINLHSKFFIKEKDYFTSLKMETPFKLITHFYVKEVSESDFEMIEKESLQSIEWGKETLGITRVPLQRPHKPQKSPALAAFLKNNFVGNAKQELMEGIIHRNLISDQDLAKVEACLTKKGEEFK